MTKKTSNYVTAYLTWCIKNTNQQKQGWNMITGYKMAQKNVRKQKQNSSHLFMDRFFPHRSRQWKMQSQPESFLHFIPSLYRSIIYIYYYYLLYCYFYKKPQTNILLNILCKRRRWIQYKSYSRTQQGWYPHCTYDLVQTYPALRARILLWQNMKEISTITL